MSSATARTNWNDVLRVGKQIVESYDTFVTLRQLFYRLVSVQILGNTETAYKTLSSRTAKARRNATFPELMDRARSIHRDSAWGSPIEILESAERSYRRDRTEGQDVSLYIGVEKAGMVVQLQHWFRHLGIPILALGGYSSQSYVSEIQRDACASGRPTVLLYAGDFDPSGEDIDRDFVKRCGFWDKVVRVALTAEQVDAHRLPINPGKSTDSRASRFIERHGELMQVELDALPPETLRQLYQGAIDAYWDQSAYDLVIEREAAEREQLVGAVAWMATQHGDHGEG